MSVKCCAVYRSSLLGGTTAFANDPWSAIEERGNGMAADGQTMTVDQIRQQQQQIIAGLCFCSFTLWCGRLYCIILITAEHCYLCGRIQ